MQSTSAVHNHINLEGTNNSQLFVSLEIQKKSTILRKDQTK